MDESKTHEYLREALRLAREGLASNRGGPFGAVVVCNGEIVGRGCNQVTSTNDPTAHAEIVAIRQACQQLQRFSLAGCELYSSCEPCPLCLAAAYWARLDSIGFAAGRDDAAAIGFDDARFYEELQKTPEQRSLPTRQALAAEGRRVLQAWLTKTDRVPY